MFCAESQRQAVQIGRRKSERSVCLSSISVDCRSLFGHSILDMKILWVKSGGIVPLDKGGRIRSHQILMELAGRHDVSLFTYYEAHEDDQHVGYESALSNLITVPLQLSRKGSVAYYADVAKSHLAGRPYTAARCNSPEVRQALKHHIDSEAYDLVLCDFIHPAELIPQDLNCPVVIFTHNVEARIWERQARSGDK